MFSAASAEDMAILLASMIRSYNGEKYADKSQRERKTSTLQETQPVREIIREKETIREVVFLALIVEPLFLKSQLSVQTVVLH